ncbi:MAG: hypothetical protein JWM21_4864 [Acidobacteria bacterium]|nr:hypothetical protein [Acidobacteriota bacterium]
MVTNLTHPQTPDDSLKGERTRQLGYLFRNAIEVAARGKRLGRTDRAALAQYLDGEDWYNKRPSRFSQEAKAARAQIMLLGRDLRRALERASNDGQLSKLERKALNQWLTSARQMTIRYQLLRGLYLVGYSMFLILIVLFFKPGFDSLNGNPLWIPFIVAVAILLVALAKDVFFERNVSITLRQITSTIEKGAEDLEGFLEENLEPRISSLESREQVRRAASKMFEDVIKDDKESRIVIFMGAASLGTPKDEEPKDLDEDKMSSIDEYNSKLTQMQNEGVTIKRYIALIKETDSPPERRKQTEKEYVNWLTKQIEILSKNPKYTLIDCPRGQPWGGSRSSIITRKAFLDMVGDGDSGFLIKGERIAEVLQRSSSKLLDLANQIIYQGGSADDLKALAVVKERVKKKFKKD